MRMLVRSEKDKLQQAQFKIMHQTTNRSAFPEVLVIVS